MGKRNIAKELDAADADRLAPDVALRTHSAWPWRRRLVLFGLLMLIAATLGVLLAPMLLTSRPAREYILTKLAAEDTVIISVNSLRFGWLTPLDAQGIRVLDARGMLLLEAHSIVSDRTLLSLLRDPRDLGTMVVSSPVLHLALCPRGSNLEEVLTKLVGHPATQPAEGLDSHAFHLQVVDASIQVTEPDTETSWGIDNLFVDIQASAVASEHWEVSAKGKLDGRDFEMAFSAPLGMPTGRWPLGPAGSASVVVDALPLAPLRYAATRLGHSFDHLSGALSTEMNFSWKTEGDPAKTAFDGRANVRLDRLSVEDSCLGDDVLELETLQLRSEFSIRDDVLTVQKCAFESDLGFAAIETSLAFSDLTDAITLGQTLRTPQLMARGTLDVAALTRTLPTTLRIRDGVEVANGNLLWNVESIRDANGARRWTGSLKTADVKVTRGGQTIDWRLPLDVNFALVAGDDFEVENASVKSDFFSLSGRGKLRSGTIHAEADLERIVLQLSQVVDISDVYADGQLRFVTQWQESEPGQLQFDSRAQLAQFVVTRREQALSEESQLTVFLRGAATLDGQMITAVDDLRLDIVSREDFLAARLQERVEDPGMQSNWPIVSRLSGALDTWSARLRPFGIGRDWEIDGTIDATANLNATRREITIHSLTGEVRDLVAASGDVEIVEPVVRIRSTGAVDLSALSCRLPHASIASQTVSMAAREISLDLQPHLTLAGEAAYRADLSRLSSYVRSEPSQALSGVFAGRMRFDTETTTSHFHIDGEIADFRFTDSATAAPIWEEPAVSLNVVGSFDALRDRVEIDRANVEGDVFSVATAGVVTDSTTFPKVEVQGEYQCDLGKVSKFVSKLLRTDIRFSGNQSQQFDLRGPLVPALAKHRIASGLRARGSFGWDEATVCEIPIGPARIQTRVVDGVLQADPFHVAVGKGRVHLAPSIHLNSESLWMTLDSASSADGVHLTREMTSSWMKYVTPLLADATSAEGAFSVALVQAEISLLHPQASRIEGQLEIHSATLGPGPLSRELIAVASQVKRLAGQGDSRVADPSRAWVQLQQQQVSFQLADGRVYHEGLEMVVDGIPIRTRGSVGVSDDSISLLAQIPIPSEWVADTPALAGLAKQSISIPINGTTSRPQIDGRALSYVSSHLVRSAARGYLQQEINSKLHQTLNAKLPRVLGERLPSLFGTPDAAQGGGDLSGDISRRLQDELGNQLNRLLQ